MGRMVFVYLRCEEKIQERTVYSILILSRSAFGLGLGSGLGSGFFFGMSLRGGLLRPVGPEIMDWWASGMGSGVRRGSGRDWGR